MNDQSEYSDEEVELAKRISIAVHSIKLNITYEKSRRLNAKFVPQASLPEKIYLEYARKLSKEYDEQLEKGMREAVENM